jgi:rubrerythrin
MSQDDMQRGSEWCEDMMSVVRSLVWSNTRRRASILMRFSQVEADGGRDLVRAAEGTADPRLRRLFLRHAADEAHHADLFRTRALELMADLDGPEGAAPPAWLAPGERGLDDLQVEREPDASLLAFLHLSERAAARDFARYLRALPHDPKTRDVFRRVLRDEGFHMTYTRQQLLRLQPRRTARLIWMARLRRLWRLYLRFAGALGAGFGAVVLSAQYFLLLPPFAWAARRAARAEPQGWSAVAAHRAGSLNRQY